MSVSRSELLDTLNTWLRPQDYQDYCPNGLQVEGQATIGHIVTGVTASQALIDAAVERGADTLLVHHGYFWKGESAVITGMKYQRIKRLLAHDMNLIAYHLPLDGHPELGNNIGLARALSLKDIQPVTQIMPQGIVYQGLAGNVELDEFAALLSAAVGRDLVAKVSGGGHQVQRVALCTGGGQSFIDAACDAGADTFISGEISEQTVHVARERGIHYLAAGHHATERFGARALGEALAQTLNINVEFIDIDSPA